MSNLSWERDEIFNPSAQRWDPDVPGDAVIGKIITMDVEEHKHGEVPVTYLQAQKSRVMRRVLLAWEVLRAEWKRLRPQFEDRILIRYDGERSGENGTYLDFSAHLDRCCGGHEWASLWKTPEDPREPPVPNFLRRRGRGGR